MKSFTKNKKMVAMAENDSIPSVDNLIVERSAINAFPGSSGMQM